LHWTDDGIVLGAKKHGETSVILELFTREHGRHLGLVHGGRSRRLQPVLQAGNTVRAVWRARLDEHLGGFAVELTELRSARLIGSAPALYALGSMAALVRLLPERDPHPDLFEAAGYLLDGLADPALAPALAVRFELMMLRDLGFGLDLTACAATGATEDLAYVSPRSGRAVSRAAGEAYKDRLFGLPPFLREEDAGEAPGREDLAAAFVLTGHFLNVHAFEPRGLALPEERARFVALSLGAPDGTRSDNLADRFSPAREG
jgi:DNA repair protein RecO (recombination protein O)